MIKGWSILGSYQLVNRIFESLSGSKSPLRQIKFNNVQAAHSHLYSSGKLPKMDIVL